MVSRVVFRFSLCGAVVLQNSKKAENDILNFKHQILQDLSCRSSFFFPQQKTREISVVRNRAPPQHTCYLYIFTLDLPSPDRIDGHIWQSHHIAQSLTSDLYLRVWKHGYCVVEDSSDKTSRLPAVPLLRFAGCYIASAYIFCLVIRAYRTRTIMKNKNSHLQKPSGGLVAAVALLLLLWNNICLVSAGERLPLSPPIAKKLPMNLTEHNDTRVDNYYWMNQRDDPEVINYLHEENNYTAAMMEHTEDLQNTLFEEIKGRIKQDDSTVPFQYKNYLYSTRNEEGKEYPFYCRQRIVSPDGELAEQEQCIDVNQYAEGQAYYSMTYPKYNGNDVAAVAVDNVGRRVYNIMFVDMSNSSSSSSSGSSNGTVATASTTTYNETIVNVTSGMAWAEDNKTLFYTKQDPETLRWYQIWRHELGTDPGSDGMYCFLI